MKLEKLEALRGFAAIYVVFHHVVPHDGMIAGFSIGFLFKFGQEAVILFFLLSGFVINYSFKQGRDKTFRSYFLKRSSRIYIPFVIVMLLGWVIESFRVNGIVNFNVKEFFLNLLMLQDISSLKPNVIVDPYMHNSPLWSLAYEWWFYMIYFPIQKYISSEKNKDILVFSTAIISSLVYFYYPIFLPRLLMYMSIWWFGVSLSNSYMRNEPMNLGAFSLPLLSLAVICIFNGAGVYEALLSGTYSSIGVHPALELRHCMFAMFAVLFALVWRSTDWIFFDITISPFLFVAPISYVVYISHYYFVVSASYLSFLNNKVIEISIYMIVMIFFSYMVERIIYPVLKKRFLNITMAPVRLG